LPFDGSFDRTDALNLPGGNSLDAFDGVSPELNGRQNTFQYIQKDISLEWN